MAQNYLKIDVNLIRSFRVQNNKRKSLYDDLIHFVSKESARSVHHRSDMLSTHISIV